MNNSIKLKDIVYCMVWWIIGGLVYSLMSKSSSALEYVVRDLFTCISLTAIFAIFIQMNKGK